MNTKLIFRQFLKKFLPFLPDTIVFRLYFFWRHRYYPNVNSPRSMTEKILWLMVWDKNPLRQTVVDRIKVREYVQEKAPQCKFPEHLWIGNTLTSEVWNTLPEKFVLKANHGSHMTAIVDKSVNTFEELLNRSKKWPQNDYSKHFGEWVYQDTPRLLIAEEKLEIDNKVPPDWKFFCANGKVFLVVMNSERTEESKFDTYFLPDFTLLDKLSMAYPTRTNTAHQKTLCFDAAVAMAEQLSAPFDFIRVDFYFFNNAVYFGELTCFPSAGMDAIKPTCFDFEFGAKIKLDRSFVLAKPRPIWKNILEWPTS
jgi:hypothetical protein